MNSSDIVIVTAGARKIAGESMENLISKNVQNMRTIMCAISRMAPKSIILMVSNPVEAMTYVAWKLSGFPAERVIGAGTTPDSARVSISFSNFLIKTISGKANSENFQLHFSC